MLNLVLPDGGDKTRINRQSRSKLENVMLRRGIEGEWLLTPGQPNPGRGSPVVVVGASEDGAALELLIKPQKSQASRTHFFLSPVGHRPKLDELQQQFKGIRAAEAAVATKATRPAKAIKPLRMTRPTLELDFDIGVTAVEERKIYAFAELIGSPRPVPWGGGLFGCRMVVTPPNGRMIMRTLNSRNRLIAPTAKHQIGSDMSAGNWKLHHQGIGFCNFPEAFLCDGQTRVAAGIEEDLPFETVVCFNLKLDAVPAIDLVRQRSVENAAHFCKIDLAKGSSSIITWTMRGYAAPAEGRPSKIAQLHFFGTHQKAFAETCGEFLKHAHEKYVSVAAVRAALVRAQYHVPANKIARFIKCLMHNASCSKPHEEIAARLAGQLRKLGATSTDKSNQRRYGLVTNNLPAFINEEAPPPALRPARFEQFSLPEERPPVRVTM